MTKGEQAQSRPSLQHNLLYRDFFNSFRIKIHSHFIGHDENGKRDKHNRNVKLIGRNALDILKHNIYHHAEQPVLVGRSHRKADIGYRPVPV